MIPTRGFTDACVFFIINVPRFYASDHAFAKLGWLFRACPGNQVAMEPGKDSGRSSRKDKNVTNRNDLLLPLLIGAVALQAPGDELPKERQLTHSAKNHMLDNNDNFSPDQRFLCYDTREMVGPGIENSRSVEKVEIATGRETVLYEAKRFVTGVQAAPGIGAVSFSPVENKVVFIHGPMVEEIAKRGYYGKPNRQGAEIAADGKGALTWLDRRDISKNSETIAGAHRGGTHRHEYSLDGKRIGFTYDDFILPQYERTVGYMQKSYRAPAPASCYFAILVAVAPRGTAKPGEIERAFGDSWVGKEGLMRAFIGKVREADGTYQESLFVVDVPADVDITTAYSGAATRFPEPPKGVKVRRLTHTRAEGIVRGTVRGDRITYYAPDANGTNQVFIISSTGSDLDPDPARRPIQATRLPNGAGPGLRWHPSGDWIVCTSHGGIVATCVKPGANFGKSTFLTPHGDGPPRDQLVLSADGKLLAYNRAVPTPDEKGKFVKTYNGQDPTQIFVLPFLAAN
jgi:hypothetical protein